MIIDLNKDNNLNYAETSFELVQLKSNKLIKEIVMQINKTGQNFMIVPMSIYNILEVNRSFKFAPLDSLMNEDPLRHMGSINDIEVYLDLFSPSDTIILKYDKSIMRDNKIDAILNGDKLKDEIEITVLGY
jgi:hypothetical protein